MLAQRRLFPHGCISHICRSNNCVVAASGSRLCIWNDAARDEGADPLVVHCGRARVIACGYAPTVSHPLVAVLQGGGGRGTGSAVHFDVGADARLIVAKTVDAPEWSGKMGGMCSCACVSADNESCSGRFICASGSYMGDVCIWETSTGSCMGSRIGVHLGPVRAIDMVRRSDGAWMLCSGGEDWRVCVSFFGTRGSLDAEGGCGSGGNTSFTIDCRVRSVCINPWIGHCIVGSQTGKVFSISLEPPRALFCSLPLDSPDIDCIACGPNFIFCCGRNGAVSRIPLSALTGAPSLPPLQQQPHAPTLPAVTSLCIDPTRMRIICLHGPSIISERPAASSDPSHIRIISHALWASPSSTMPLPSTRTHSSALSSTACLAADGGVVAVFGCRGDAVLIRDGFALQLVTQTANCDRFYICCCRFQYDGVLAGAAIRSNGTIFGFRTDDAGRGTVASAEFGVANRLGRCSALDCAAVDSCDLIACVGSIAGTLVVYFGPALFDGDSAPGAGAGDGHCDFKNAVLIIKKLHGVKPISCIHLKPTKALPDSGTAIHLYSAGHDGCIVFTLLHVARDRCDVMAQQRARSFDSAPIVAFNVCNDSSSSNGSNQISCTSIHNGRVLHSHGPFPLPSPPTAVGVIDQYRFSMLAAACTSSAVLLADVCKGQVRVMAADTIVGCHRIIPGIHTDVINDIAVVFHENTERDAAGISGLQGIICTVSTDGCCCICSIPSSSSSATTPHIFSRLHAHASQVAGSALTCVKVIRLGSHRALVVAGGAFSCVHVWLLLLHPPDSSGCGRVDAISHATHTCNACDDEGKCVSAMHCSQATIVDADAGVQRFECRISACLNDGRVEILSCLVSSQGSISLLPSKEPPFRFSHAILCVAADSSGKIFFGLSNGCLRFTDTCPLHSLPTDGSSADISHTPPPSSFGTGSPHPPSTILPPHRALHIAGLNALLPLDYGVIMCGGEDGCVSLVSVGVDRRVSVHEMRHVSDGAVKRLLLLRCGSACGGRSMKADVGVICHNQRALAVSVQLHDMVSTNIDPLTSAGRGIHSNICRAHIISVSADVVLDVGKSWSACVVGAVAALPLDDDDDDDDASAQSSALVAIGGWGIQAIRM